jgi:hypothetical protein
VSLRWLVVSVCVTAVAAVPWVSHCSGPSPVVGAVRLEEPLTAGAPYLAEATEEAILNALLRAETMVGRDGHVRHALPIDRVTALLRAARRPA